MRHEEDPIDSIRQFGAFDPTATYVLRPGGYSVIVRPANEIAIVSTNGKFYLPGGGQEVGESAERAAVREAMEECGMQIQIVRRIGVADELVFAENEATYFRKRCSFFRAELRSEKIGAGEPDHELIWVPTKKAISFLRHDSQKWAVAENAA